MSLVTKRWNDTTGRIQHGTSTSTTPYTAIAIVVLCWEVWQLQSKFTSSQVHKQSNNTQASLYPQQT